MMPQKIYVQIGKFTSASSRSQVNSLPSKKFFSSQQRMVAPEGPVSLGPEGGEKDR
jgi:hypothetical protein